MKIQVALLPTSLPTAEIANNDIAVVIDTLRFTSTACQALHEGAAAVWVATDPAEVDELVSSHRQASNAGYLRCGERLCRPIDGFDMGNSPWEYSRNKIANRHLFFTTTNGTQAVKAVQQAAKVHLAALVNRAAVAQALLDSAAASVCIVCAGTDGAIALEDVIAAGAIVDHLLLHAPTDKKPNLEGDSPWIALSAWRDAAAAKDSQRPSATGLVESFANAAGGRNLIESGYQRDLEFAAQVDLLNIVPTSNHQSWRCFSSGASTNEA